MCAFVICCMSVCSVARARVCSLIPVVVSRDVVDDDVVDLPVDTQT